MRCRQVLETASGHDVDAHGFEVVTAYVDWIGGGLRSDLSRSLLGVDLSVMVSAASHHRTVYRIARGAHARKRLKLRDEILRKYGHVTAPGQRGLERHDPGRMVPPDRHGEFGEAGDHRARR